MMYRMVRRLLADVRPITQRVRQDSKTAWFEQYDSQTSAICQRLRERFGCQAGREQHATDPRCRNVPGRFAAPPDRVLTAWQKHERDHERWASEDGDFVCMLCTKTGIHAHAVPVSEVPAW